jgi:hypothetical protein
MTRRRPARRSVPAVAGTERTSPEVVRIRRDSWTSAEAFERVRFLWGPFADLTIYRRIR